MSLALTTIDWKQWQSNHVGIIWDHVLIMQPMDWFPLWELWVPCGLCGSPGHRENHWSLTTKNKYRYTTLQNRIQKLKPPGLLHVFSAGPLVRGDERCLPLEYLDQDDLGLTRFDSWQRGQVVPRLHRFEWRIGELTRIDQIYHRLIIDLSRISNLGSTFWISGNMPFLAAKLSTLCNGAAKAACSSL